MSKKPKVDLFGSSEPTWEHDYTQTDIHKALSWYNLNKSDKDAAKYLGISDASIARRFTTLAWATRMKSRGCKMPENSEMTLQQMKEKLNEFIRASAPVVVDTENVISIQERVQAKTDEFIGELEGMVDVFGIKGQDAAEMNVYQWMVDHNVKPMHASKIAEYYRARAEKVFAAVGDVNDKEYYSGYGAKALKNLLACYANIVKDAEKIASNASVARKPRKKKPISFEKKVKNLKYLAREDSLKLVSIDPVRIIGASQLWVYNVKTRKLGVYNAMDAAGLMVKGTSIENYSESSSICKTLRKPEKTLKIVTDGGKIALRKALDDVNSKPIKLNGRLNKDTVLLRVV